MLISYEEQSGKTGITVPTSSKGIYIAFDGERFIVYDGDTPTMWSKYLINNTIEDLMYTTLKFIANEVFYDLRGIIFVYDKTLMSDKALDFGNVKEHLQKQNIDNVICYLSDEIDSIQRNNDKKFSNCSCDWHPYLGNLSDFD